MKRILKILICLGSLAVAAVPARAAGLSTEDIVCGLDPHCKRPLSRDMRGVTATGGPTGSAPLAVNLYVNFEFNSADLTSDGRITLDRLGYALIDDRLKAFSMMVEGHTDAKGGADYNQQLSERRADTVRQYLISQFGVDPSRLTARGFGKSRLLDAARPEDGVNRRVQVLNLSVGASSQGGR
jgi:outer membrane protein OmpA-like peptidoglycan-associated protein